MKIASNLISVLLVSILSASAAGTPSGFLDSSSNFVRANSNVELNWKINIPPPPSIDPIIEITPDEEIIPTTELIAEVRVLGAAMGSFLSPMYGEAFIKVGNSEWDEIFAGWANGIGAGSSETYLLPPGQPVEFMFRTWNKSSPWRSSDKWGSMRTPVTTGTNDDRLFILRDGDEAPSYEGDFDQANSMAFVAPYLDTDGKTIKIGANDLLIFAELNEKVDRISDFQDFVVLISFKRP